MGRRVVVGVAIGMSFALIACAAENVGSIHDDDSPITTDPDGGPGAPPDGASVDAVLGSDAERDGAYDARDESVSPTPDAALEAGEDAAPDGVAPDAGPDANEPPPVLCGNGAMDPGEECDDSNVMSGDGCDSTCHTEPPSPICINGSFRCDVYQRQKCVANDWQWQVGDQSCCHDPRFAVAGSTVVDSVTNYTWYRNGGRGSGSLCPVLLAGGRLPTSAELLDITIGPPVMNKSVCSPTIDQVAFQSVYAGDTVTSDGCVDLIRATSKAACGANPGFLCVSP